MLKCRKKALLLHYEWIPFLDRNSIPPIINNTLAPVTLLTLGIVGKQEKTRCCDFSGNETKKTKKDKKAIEAEVKVLSELRDLRP